MAESSDSYGVCAHLLSCTFCRNRDGNAGNERAQGEKVRAWGFACGILLPDTLLYRDL